MQLQSLPLASLADKSLTSATKRTELMRVTAERLKARAEQLRKQGIKVRPVLDTITGNTQKLPDTTARTRTGNDADKKAVQERSRLAS